MGTLNKPLPGQLEKEDFYEILREHQSMVFSIAFWILDDRAAAERTSEEVFLQLHGGFAGLTSSQIRSWLRRAAVRDSLDRLQQRSQEPETALNADCLFGSPSLVGPPMPRVSLGLRQLTASLPLIERTAVVLRFQEEMSPEEIGNVLDLPAGKVNRHLQKSLRLLGKSAASIMPKKKRSMGYKLSLLPSKEEEKDEFNEALHEALAPLPAPRELIQRVEWRLTAVRPVAVPPGFHTLSVGAYSRGTSVWSGAAHAGVIALIALLVIFSRHQIRHEIHETVTPIDISQYLPIQPKPAEQMSGGGGGGTHDILQAPKAKLPKVEKQPVAAPLMVIKNDHPKLVATPAIKMPQNVQLATNNMPNLGDPRTSVVGPLSNGTGADGGIGSGSSGGIGSGGGIGYGSGQGAGYGGGLYHVGGGVSAPQVIYSPQPEFTDAARRAKYEGVCIVSLVVDAQGNPQRVRIVRHLGMGLDEKALEAVRRYKFKPAMLQGRPVPVEVQIQVNFHLY